MTLLDEYTRPAGARARSSGVRSAPRARGLGPRVAATDERLDRVDVLQHRLLGGAGVPPGDGAQDLAVALVGAFRTAGRAQRLLAALGEQIHDRVRDPRDGAV